MVDMIYEPAVWIWQRFLDFLMINKMVSLHLKMKIGCENDAIAMA